MVLRGRGWPQDGPKRDFGRQLQRNQWFWGGQVIRRRAVSWAVGSRSRGFRGGRRRGLVSLYYCTITRRLETRRLRLRDWGLGDWRLRDTMGSRLSIYTLRPTRGRRINENLWEYWGRNESSCKSFGTIEKQWRSTEHVEHHPNVLKTNKHWGESLNINDNPRLKEPHQGINGKHELLI